MKRIFVIMISLMLLSSCATTQKVSQDQSLFTKINSLEQQLKEKQNQNQELQAQLAQIMEKLETVEKNKTPLPELTAKTKDSEKKEIPQPIAPVRPAINAYINQQIAAGPHIVAIKNASSKIWMAFEIDSRPVIFIKNGFPNVYKSNQGIVNCLPPGEVAFLELKEIGGRTTVKARGFTGVTPPLQFQKERSRTYKFGAYSEQYQIVIFDRWDF